jgi:hypothetical protein
MRLEQVSPLSPNSILTWRFELLSERRKSRAAALEEEPVQLRLPRERGRRRWIQKRDGRAEKETSRERDEQRKRRADKENGEDLGRSS